MLYHMTACRITNRETCKAFMSEFEDPFLAPRAHCISVYLHPHCAGVDAHTICLCAPCPTLLPNGYSRMVFDARTMLDYIYRSTMRRHH